mgnify:CR=1 FL=1
MPDSNMPAPQGNGLLEMTTQIVSAFVSNNSLKAEDLPGLVRIVHDSLAGLGAAAPAPEPQKPAVSIRKSIGEDFLICLEDGKKLKMLKRYLRSRYNMTPEEYRAKWKLASDYPMVAPNYAKQRSDFAMKIGLGKRGKK